MCFIELALQNQIPAERVTRDRFSYYHKTHPHVLTTATKVSQSSEKEAKRAHEICIILMVLSFWGSVLRYRALADISINFAFAPRPGEFINQGERIKPEKKIN